MAVMKSEDGKELMIDCECGCDEGMRLSMDPEDPFGICILTYTNGKFYRDQDDSLWNVICKKVRKIWAILTNHDYYYSEICMTKEDFDLFREYLNKF